jgi:hypothetical protein
MTRFCVSLVLICGVADAQTSAAPMTEASDQGLKPILTYISSAWDTLTRSMNDCASVVDPKIKVSPVLYLPAGFEEPTAVKKLTTDCHVNIEHLPLEIHRLGEIDTSKIQPHGLPSGQIRCARWSLQRDVWLGQLLHYSRVAPGWTRGTGARNDRQLLF